MTQGAGWVLGIWGPYTVVGPGLPHALTLCPPVSKEKVPVRNGTLSRKRLKIGQIWLNIRDIPIIGNGDTVPRLANSIGACIEEILMSQKATVFLYADHQISPILERE